MIKLSIFTFDITCIGTFTDTLNILVTLGHYFIKIIIPRVFHLNFNLILFYTEVSVQFSSVQSLSCVWLFATTWIVVRQISLSITNSRSSLKLISIESVMLSSHLILCRPLLLLPPTPPASEFLQWVNSLHEVAKVLEFQISHQSFQRTPRTDCL